MHMAPVKLERCPSCDSLLQSLCIWPSFQSNPSCVSIPGEDTWSLPWRIWLTFYDDSSLLSHLLAGTSYPGQDPTPSLTSAPGTNRPTGLGLQASSPYLEWPSCCQEACGRWHYLLVIDGIFQIDGRSNNQRRREIRQFEDLFVARAYIIRVIKPLLSRQQFVYNTSEYSEIILTILTLQFTCQARLLLPILIHIIQNSS